LITRSTDGKGDAPWPKRPASRSSSRFPRPRHTNQQRSAIRRSRAPRATRIDAAWRKRARKDATSLVGRPAYSRRSEPIAHPSGRWLRDVRPAIPIRDANPTRRHRSRCSARPIFRRVLAAPASFDTHGEQRAFPARVPEARTGGPGCGCSTWAAAGRDGAERGQEPRVRATAVTLSRAQAEWADKTVAEAGLAERIQIRYQDYRDVADGPFDAISSIGMFEQGAVAAPNLLRRAAPAAQPGRPTVQPRDLPPAERRPYALPAEELHRPATSSPTASCTRSAPSSCVGGERRDIAGSEPRSRRGRRR
jgi:Mycolic acid cyclopropane synthetase